MPNTCPPTLLGLQDTIERHPDARGAILGAEIAHREREVIMLRLQRGLLQLQVWSVIQSAVGAGFFVFATGWFLSQMVGFAKSLQKIEGLNAGLGTNALTRGIQANITAMLPSSTTLRTIAVLPEWTTQQLLWAALTVFVTLLVFGVIRGIQLWQMSRQLKKGIEVTEGEIGVLRSWK